MTTAADDPAVEDAFEAYLAGRPVPGEATELAAFAEAVRASATRPGRPNPALAELLATGLLADHPSPSTRTARSAGPPPLRRASRIRNRRRFAMIFPVLLTKFLSAGAVAQAATGAGIIVVAVTGAGAAGVLPDPLQNTVAAAVETVTPFELPGDEETVPDEEPVAEEPLTDEETADEETAIEDPAVEDGEDVPAAFDMEAWALNGPAEGQTFGSWVSEAARHGGVDGQVVRDWAHRKHVDLEDVDLGDVDLGDVDLGDVEPDETTEVTPAPAPEVEAETPEAETEVATTERGKGGKGGNAKSGGSGNAKGGKGNGRN